MNLELVPLEIIDKCYKINLPGSKSQSNRALILKYISEFPVEIINLSTAKDTQVLEIALQKLPPIIDVHHAGTAFRFLTAYLSIIEGDRILTGSNRLKERPIHLLVDALRTLGARIDYMEKEGYAPLRIIGDTSLSGQNLRIDASISSQFISALMMIGPRLKKGLSLQLVGEVVSNPFIHLTKKMMEQLGVKVSFLDSKIDIAESSYQNGKMEIEADYASSSYWYSLLLFLPNNIEFKFIGLVEESFQPDRLVVELYSKLGIQSEFEENSLTIKKISNFQLPKHLKLNLSDAPDLAQSIVVVCAGLEIELTLEGLKTLSIKETNRIKALKIELEKFGLQVDITIPNRIHLWGSFKPNKDAVIETYNDHRMAMSMSILFIKNKGIKINNPDVVEKSYPDFWVEMQRFATINKKSVE